LLCLASDIHYFSLMANESFCYNPLSLLHTFNNSLNQDAVKKIFQIKGIYIAGKGTSYNNFYYDSLKDENSDTSITLVIPGIIRSKLHNQECIEFTAFLTKKIQFSSGKIDLQVNLVELLSTNKASHSEEELKTFEILQTKAQIGYKDVDSFIKKRIIDNEKISIKIIIGKNAIIDSDIKHQLQDAISLYDVEFIRVGLTAESEILYAINHYSNNADILVISRGGGENMSIFNNTFIAEQILHLKCYFVTAIGHKEDNSLIQKVADKAFITPTAFGQYLREIYNTTIEELQNSKVNLVKQVTSQLEANYSKQLQNLNDARLLEENKLKLANEKIQVLESQKKQFPIWLIIFLTLIGILIGVLLTLFFKS